MLNLPPLAVFSSRPHDGPVTVDIILLLHASDALLAAAGAVLDVV